MANKFGFNIKPLKIKPINIYGQISNSKRTSRRNIGIRDKQILYRNAKGRCQNPACKKKIEFDEMQTGHKTAYSKGGGTTLNNSVCLCYRCNKLQGTDSWEKFLRKQGINLEKKKTDRKRKPKKKKSNGQMWLNPITGKKEKFDPFGI